MFRTASFVVAALAAVGLVGICVSDAAAQATITSTPYSTYAPYSPYWYGYSSDPYLQGASAVIQAQGQLMVNQQQAFLMKEQVRSARIENRRKELEQWLWERDHMPTPEDERQRFKEEQLRRARFGSEPTEIWSGKALNNLLADARKIPLADVPSGQAPLSEDVLAKINVTSGKGNIGLFKAGKISWPLLLKRSDFEKDRERLNHLTEQALQQASGGQINTDALEQMIRTSGQLQDKLISMAKEAGDNANWTQAMYSDARSFLNHLDDAVRALQQPDAVDHLSGKYSLKGKTIAEVVKFMTDKGLEFAPATEGSQAAYNSFYQALRAYDEAAGSKVRDKR